MGNHKGLPINRTIWRKRTNAGGIILSGFEMRYKATVTKPAWRWCADSMRPHSTGQKARREAHTRVGDWSRMRVSIIHNGEGAVSSVNNAEKSEAPCAEE